MDSNALILHGSDTQDGTLIRPGVGLTMAQFMNAGGKVVTRVLNAGYSGPYDPKNHIQDFFSEGKERERALDELYKADRNDLTKQHKQLLDHCHALLKYALPECTLKTQLITFKILVAVITRYPGIRCLFHNPKYASPPPASHFENLWNRPHQQCGEEWTFYRDFAVYCLTDRGPLTKLVESELPGKFGRLKTEYNWTKDPIESLLSFCSADSTLNTEKLCAIRCLAGILELPKIWRLKTKEGVDIGKRLFGFLSHLCETIFQLIRDTEPSGSGDSEDDPSPLWTSARSAVDILAVATFGGFLQLHDLYEELPPCPSQLPSIVTLLIRPQMERSFPKASGCALQFKEILCWQQNAGTNSQSLTPQFETDHGPTENRRREERREAGPSFFGWLAPILPTRMGNNSSKSKRIIVLVGPTGCGKSQFIRFLVPEDKKHMVPVNRSLTPITEPIQAFEMENHTDKLKVILVDTPGFEETGLNSPESVLNQVVEWMKQNHRKTKVAGILCLYNIRAKRLTNNLKPPTSLLKDLCGDRADAAKQVALVTTHWDKIKSKEGEEKERQLKRMTWTSLSAKGAKMERFNKTEEAARGIIKRLVSNTT